MDGIHHAQYISLDDEKAVEEVSLILYFVHLDNLLAVMLHKTLVAVGGNVFNANCFIIDCQEGKVTVQGTELALLDITLFHLFLLKFEFLIKSFFYLSRYPR